MADRRWRCTWRWNYLNTGWTETWWLVGPTMSSIALNVNTYTAARQACLPPDGKFQSVRISVQDESRFGRTIYPALTDTRDGPNKFLLFEPGTYTPATAGEPFDTNRMAMRYETVVTGTHIGSRYFAIIPDAASGTGATPLNYGTPTKWFAAWEAWRANVLASKWQVRVSTPTVLGQEVPIKRWQLSTATPADWQVVLSPRTALPIPATPTRVRVRGARMKFSGLRSPNGVWDAGTVTLDSANDLEFITLPGTAGLSLTQLSSQGKIAILTPSYLTPDWLFAIGVGEHKRGGPFPRSRGRRSAPRFPPL